MSLAKPQPATGAKSFSELSSLLRCIGCGNPLAVTELVEDGGYPELGPDGRLKCPGCDRSYPIMGGTPRLLPSSLQAGLRTKYPLGRTELPAEGNGRIDAEQEVKRRTGESFAYEWERFGFLRPEWRKNFLDYMQPQDAGWFDGKLVLDVGAGSGRHSFHAVALGARVVALDIGRSIDVARRNLPPEVLTVQADAESVPFEQGAFDLVMSIGVLHHLPDTGRALRSLVSYARPGGLVKVYLYWRPRARWQRIVLGVVTAARRVTVRMPHRLLHPLCYPLSAVLMVGVVWPHRLLRRFRIGRAISDRLPLGTYTDYPFGVLVNDQFDRFSAPIERRFTEQEVRELLEASGLTDVVVLPNYGWVGTGRRPTK